jgi:hypothetical protein
VSIEEHHRWRQQLEGRAKIAASIAAVEEIIGRNAMPIFLDTPQPGLGGQTGREVLQENPEAVFDALEADPVLDHLPSYQSSKKAARLLSILDGLGKGDA